MTDWFWIIQLLAYLPFLESRVSYLIGPEEPDLHASSQAKSPSYAVLQKQ